MADTLRPRLDRLQELSKQVNVATDDAGRVVQGVESYLTDVLRLGTRASIRLEFERDEEGFFWSEKRLEYGRYGPKYRIYVVDAGEQQGHYAQTETLWANCPRDVKLMAFERLPDLLDELIRTLEGTLDQVRANSEAIQSLLPPSTVREKGAKS
jgi:hypothetical protein